MGGSFLLLSMLVVRYLSGSCAREIWTVFLTMQTVKWFVGALKSEFRLVEFPVRLFPYATHQDFVTDFALCPTMAVLYAMFVRERTLRVQLFYALWFAAAYALWSWTMTRWTNLQVHLRWSSWFDFLLVLVMLPAVKRISDWIVTTPTAVAEGQVRP
ncbi:CBO0543 family protein [Cohnella sp. OV330]|uniref:CBO0543 family protein n=1 Tax=Cohnella sp. OV330 TaxID=1855288 RepID=UPI000B7EC889|nr:CBO0543 family protein [Cohnella sp. OV330]